MKIEVSRRLHRLFALSPSSPLPDKRCLATLSRLLFIGLSLGCFALLNYILAHLAFVV